MTATAPPAPHAPVPSAQPPARVAVVVLSYQSRHLLARFLPALADSVARTPGAELWVVDNASTDGTTEYLHAEWPGVRVHTLAVNRGFTNGYVASLPHIPATYYVLINSDVAVTPDWLGAPLALLEANPRIAAVQPRIRAEQQPTHFEYSGAAGGYLDRWGYPYCRGRVFFTLEADRDQYADARPVFWGSGACLFLRADAYFVAGGLDNSFYAHMEEIDLCWRLQLLGWQVWVCPASTVYHVGGSVIKYNSPAKLRLNYRNGLAMLCKNLPLRRLWGTLAVRLLLDGVAGLRALLQGHWRETLAIVQAHFAFYGRLPALLRARRSLWRQVRAVRARDGVTRHPIAGWEHRTLVWDYFIRRRRTFDRLPPAPLVVGKQDGNVRSIL